MSASTGKPEASNRILSVLLADDDESLRATVAEILDARGFRVLQAATGLEALNIAENEPVNLGVFDFHLPDFTGVQLYRRIYSRRHTTLPTILMTSDRSAEVTDLVTNAGIARLLHKPLDVDPFTRALNEIVREYFPA